jgi:hypothetical protein
MASTPAFRLLDVCPNSCQSTACHHVNIWRVAAQRCRCAFTLQVYFAKMPHKTHHLRADSLAIMLSLANVGAYAEVSSRYRTASPCVLLHVRLWLWQSANMQR